MNPTKGQVLLRWTVVGVSLAFLILVICGYLFGLKWTGLPKQTLWDWLKLLIVPAVLAVGGYLFTRSESRATQAAAERRAQDEALQAYLDQMSGMLIPTQDQPSLYKSRPGDGLSSVARARTLTVLPRLDGDRKARVVQFLYESGLIVKGRTVLDLRDANLWRAELGQTDLRGADLRKVDLNGAHLYETDLSEADLRKVVLNGTFLIGADLSGADLRGGDLILAKLSGADLSGANLSGANLGESVLSRVVLRGANLSEADLIGADLSHADLRHADLRNTDLRIAKLIHAHLIHADLSGANLLRADLLEARADLLDAHPFGGDLLGGGTEERLDQAKSLKDATMPDGQVLKGPESPNGPTFTEWRKSKGRGEDRENSPS